MLSKSASEGSANKEVEVSQPASEKDSQETVVIDPAEVPLPLSFPLRRQNAMCEPSPAVPVRVAVVPHVPGTNGGASCRIDGFFSKKELVDMGLSSTGSPLGQPSLKRSSSSAG